MMPSAEPHRSALASLKTSKVITFVDVACGIIRCKVTSACAHARETVSIAHDEAVLAVFLYFVVRLHRDRGECALTLTVRLNLSVFLTMNGEEQMQQTWPER